MKRWPVTSAGHHCLLWRSNQIHSCSLEWNIHDQLFGRTSRWWLFIKLFMALPNKIRMNVWNQTVFIKIPGWQQPHHCHTQYNHLTYMPLCENIFLILLIDCCLTGWRLFSTDMVLLDWNLQFLYNVIIIKNNVSSLRHRWPFRHYCWVVISCTDGSRSDI